MAIKKLTDILDKRELQVLQDKFSQITGVASVLTDVDGTPITEYSGFCSLCTAIRNHPEGDKDCREIASSLCNRTTSDERMYRCPRLGLLEGGTQIYIGDNHIGNWIIGQMRTDDFDQDRIFTYTETLGFDDVWVRDAINHIKGMEESGFRMILELLQLFANQLSALAYRKHLLKKEISEKKSLSRQLNYLTFYDPDTGLINRDLCLEIVRHLIEIGERTQGGGFSLVMISPDNLTHQREIYGTEGVEKIISHLSGVLKQSVRQVDTVSRFSAEEFLLILEYSELSEYSPERVYSRICQALDTRLILDNSSLLKIAIHGGMVSWTSLSDESADGLIRKSYAALQESRKKDMNTLFSYTDDMYKSLMVEYELEKNFEMAMINEEIVPYYQPIVRLEDGIPHLYGFEVLARWNHPQYGILMPGLFIPMAEKHNILRELSQYMIREASRFIKEINVYHPESPLFISINITPEEFIQRDFVKHIKGILEEEDLPGKWLKLEITENSVLKGGEVSLQKIQELNELGVSLSMDDFGTGYSNLSLLSRLPLNNIKLDHSLILMAEKNEPFIQAVINLARSLNMEIIAEGVEKESQIDILKKMGCFLHQGFYYSHPLDEESVKVLKFANSPVRYL